MSTYYVPAHRYAADPDRGPALYDRRGVVVSWRRVYAGGYQYEIDDLRDVVRVRGSVHPGVLVSMALAVVVPVAVVPALTTAATVPTWLAVFVAVLVPCLVAVACAKRWPARRVLRARYHGRTVVLFSTRDEREFGQVSRAVHRAREAVGRELP